MVSAAEIDRRRAELGAAPRALDTRAASPSIRQFGEAIDRGRAELERVPVLPAGRPDLAACARALEEAEVLALGLRADSLDELAALAAVARAARVPVLRADLLLEEAQVWESRLAGADAVLLHAEVLGPHATVQLARAATASHMSPCIACGTQEQVDAAAAVRGAVIALARPGLSLRLPPRVRTLALFDEPGLAGRVDALLDDALGASPDPAALFRSLTT